MTKKFSLHASRYFELLVKSKVRKTNLNFSRKGADISWSHHA